MDVRKKLVKLLGSVSCNGNGESLGSCPDRKYGLCREVANLSYCVIQNTANYLVAHGVTVQELDGCDFCQKFDFAGARAEVNKYGAHISLGVCGTKFPNKEQFKFCPMCGRRLPEPPKGE